MSPCRIFCSKYKKNTMKGNELDCKPGYVESDHLSRIYVTIKLKQPTWNAAGNCIIPQAPLQKLYLVLLRMGFTEPVMLPWQRWALTSPFHPYHTNMAVYFCCTGLGVASTGRYPASCPVKPGLSSPARMQPRSSVLLIIFSCFCFRLLSGKLLS